MITADELRLQAAPSRGRVWTMLLVGGAALAGQQIVSGGPMLRVVIAGVVVLALAIPAMERPKSAVIALFILLPFLGMIRHMFLSALGAAELDPLLLVTSAVTFVIFVSLMLNHEIDFGGTPLAKVVFFLVIVGIIQVFNPLQAPTYSRALLIGFTGVMINLVPIAFFFIARSIADPELVHKVLRIVLVVGTLAGLYGLFQVFFGFRGFERTWLGSQGFTALQVGGTTRPFSIFNNPAEYAAYLHYAFVIAMAMLLFGVRKRTPLMLAIVAMIGYAGFLIGSRGFTVKVVAGAIVLLAARARNGLLATGIVAMLVSALVFWSATTSSDGRIEEQKEGASQLIEQQFRALRDPFDPAKSTLPIHWEAATTGITYAATKQPFGLGTGVATRGGAKFGGLQAGTELDIGDSFLSLGLLGGGLYLMAILLAVTQASRVRRALPGPVWIGIWVMAVTSIGAWMNGGNYAITPLIWFMLGAADGAYKRMRDRGLITR